MQQLRAWAYDRQRLGNAAPDAAAALRDVIAVYSSHPSAPLSLHARCRGLDAAGFRSLDVLRLPAMRASIHLLPAETAHLPFRALLEPAARAARRLKHFGVDEESYARIRAAVLDAAEQPLTQEQLQEATGEEAKPLKGVTAMMTREGSLLRIGADGLRSNALRYQAAEIAEADGDEALAWLAGEYLRAFGPVRAKDFQWWAGVTAGRAKRALAQHDTEELDGGLHIRRQDRAGFESVKPVKDRVDLLPKWDCLTMGYAPDGRDRFADPDIVDRCYDFRGDGRPVILVDGRAAGTWELRGAAIETALFDRATPALQRALDERVAANRALLG